MLKGVAWCHSSVVLALEWLYTRAVSMTFLWDLYDTPDNLSHGSSITTCFYDLLKGWLKINQFADLDGLSGLKA